MHENTPDHVDPDRCASCGGRCCAIYKRDNIPNSYWFEEWVDDFHDNSEAYGVAALFDPRVAHQCDAEPLREELSRKGIDVDYCQYFNRDSGCMIPRERRPAHCRSFRCEAWRSGAPSPPHEEAARSDCLEMQRADLSQSSHSDTPQSYLARCQEMSLSDPTWPF